MASVTLITGGCRSGKSLYAQELACLYPQERRFIATAVAFDSEMGERIKKHRQERGGQFLTVEEPYNLASAIITAYRENPSVILIDCLTVWVGNLLYRYENEPSSVEKSINDFLSAIENPLCDLVIVTNEVGMGIVPDNASARYFRDCAGSLNRNTALRSGNVILCVCGIPVAIKGDCGVGRGESQKK